VTSSSRPALGGAPDLSGRADAWEAREAAARNGFDRLLALAKQAGVRASDVLAGGVPAVEIARAARERHATLIVMGASRRSATTHAVPGGVAAGVIADAPCWVVTVRE
jgi:nucleotide-binding universal stress UspA family protein